MTPHLEPDSTATPVSPPGTTEALIDAALRSVGTADPASDLQGRILNRLAAERIGAEVAAASSPLLVRLRRLTHVSTPALCGLSACVFAGIIVLGSVSHSHKLHTNPILAPPVLALPAHGLGAASAVHPAAPASTPAPVGQESRGRSARNSKQGRARIAPHAHKAPGIAVPAPPANSQN